jgi:predicted dehydrogenase
VQTALGADRLLGVDLSYRFVEGARKIRRHIQAGDIGTVYAVDLVFHNAYGPDKAWYYQPQAAGGGCVIDLGIHLVDFVLWALDFPRVTDLSSRLFAQGALLNGRRDVVEDYATARFDLDTGVTVNLACSWRLPAGRDAIIKAVFYGTEGGLCLRNVNGSFYDFKAERFHGTSRQTLQQPPDEWGGRAVVAWTGQLARVIAVSQGCRRDSAGGRSAGCHLRAVVMDARPIRSLNERYYKNNEFSALDLFRNPGPAHSDDCRYHRRGLALQSGVDPGPRKARPRSGAGHDGRAPRGGPASRPAMRFQCDTV